MPNLRPNEEKELEACKQLLSLTQSGKVTWNYELSGQVYCARKDVFFSLYFPNAEITSNDTWRRFTVQTRQDDDATRLTDIFAIANPSDKVPISLGVRPASQEAKKVLDDLSALVLAVATDQSYGIVFKALE